MLNATISNKFFLWVLALSTLSLGLKAEAQSQAQDVKTASSIQSATTLQASPTSVLDAQLDDLTSEEQKSFSGEVRFQSGTNLYEDSSPKKTSTTNLYLGLSYKPNEDWNFALLSVITKELKDDQELSASNTRIRTYYKKFAINRSLSFQPGAVTFLPTNEKDREKGSYRGALGLEPWLHFDMRPFKLPIRGYFRPNLVKNIHEYNVSAEGEPNTEFSNANLLNLDFLLSKKWTLNAYFTLTNAWTYRRFHKQSFDFGQELIFNPVDTWAVSVGHSNSGSALKPNLSDSNIAIYNEKSSTVFGSVSYLF